MFPRLKPFICVKKMCCRCELHEILMDLLLDLARPLSLEAGPRFHELLPARAEVPALALKLIIVALTMKSYGAML